MNSINKTALAFIFLFSPLVFFSGTVLAGSAQGIAPPETQQPEQAVKDVAAQAQSAPGSAPVEKVPPTLSPDQDKALSPVDQTKPVGKVSIEAGKKPGEIVLTFDASDDRTKKENLKMQGAFSKKGGE